MIAVAMLIAAAAPVTTQAEVTTVLEASVAGWNAGSLERFMAAYTGDAVYVTNKGIVQGRTAIAERYRPSFAGGANARGKLNIQPLAYRTLSKVHFLLFARWTLTPVGQDAKPETGMTTLLFERRAEGWRIISDHSS